MARINDALKEVRAQGARRIKRQGYEPVLIKPRWLLLKRKGKLKQQEKGRLRDLLYYDLRTVRAYLLKRGLPAVLGVHGIDMGREVP